MVSLLREDANMEEMERNSMEVKKIQNLNAENPPLSSSSPQEEEGSCPGGSSSGLTPPPLRLYLRRVTQAEGGLMG